MKSMLKFSEYVDQLRSISIDYCVERIKTNLTFCLTC